MIVLCLALWGAATVHAQNQDWWKNAVFYQIYPRSFKDSNNDGIGDLKGIIQKLPHLANAGVTAAWLSPIYASPQVDAGYDISNFTDIDKDYGTLADFDELVVKAKSLGLKIVMDFVPNHSSDQHAWFAKSENREPGYEDYYVWKDAASNGDPPNNWLSVFKYSAWKWSDIRQQYYLHQFAYQQPDLNFRNPKVVQEMKDILTFWMDRGVDGFRVDAIPHMFEDDEFRNEPLSFNPNVQPWEYDYLDHIYTKDHPLTFDMVYQFRDWLDEYTAAKGGDARILMTEAYTTLENTMLYYGNADQTRHGAHFSFNFILITDLNVDSSAQGFVNAVQKWMKVMPSQYTANWVLGNHDQHRVATRYGKANVDGLNMLVTMLPGVGVTYNGEEIGMENGQVTWPQGQDPNACNGVPEDFAKVSRDFERTPFQWDDTVNAGFNEGAEPWLPVSSKYVLNNLADQMEKERSHFQVFQACMRLRKQLAEVISKGDFKIAALAEEVIAVYRNLPNAHGSGIGLIYNKGMNAETIDLHKAFPNISNNVKVEIYSVTSTRLPGDHLHTKKIALGAYEAIIFSEI